MRVVFSDSGVAFRRMAIAGMPAPRCTWLLSGAALRNCSDGPPGSRKPRMPGSHASPTDSRFPAAGACPESTWSSSSPNASAQSSSTRWRKIRRWLGTGKSLTAWRKESAGLSSDDQCHRAAGSWPASRRRPTRVDGVRMAVRFRRRGDDRFLALRARPVDGGVLLQGERASSSPIAVRLSRLPPLWMGIRHTGLRRKGHPDAAEGIPAGHDHAGEWPQGFGRSPETSSSGRRPSPAGHP